MVISPFQRSNVVPISGYVNRTDLLTANHRVSRIWPREHSFSLMRGDLFASTPIPVCRAIRQCTVFWNLLPMRASAQSGWHIPRIFSHPLANWRGFCKNWFTGATACSHRTEAAHL